MSEKSIARHRSVRRSLFAARPARADDADAFAIASPPHGVGDDEHTAPWRRPSRAARSKITTSSAARSWCSGRKRTGSGCNERLGLLGAAFRDLGPVGRHHPVDEVAVDPVAAHSQRGAQLVLELQVPRERRALEAMEQRHQPAVPVVAPEVDAVDAGVRQAGGVTFGAVTQPSFVSIARSGGPSSKQEAAGTARATRPSASTS